MNEFLLTTFVAFIITLIKLDEEIKGFYSSSLVVVLVKITFHNSVRAVFFVELEKLLNGWFSFINFKSYCKPKRCLVAYALKSGCSS